jgi:hypothetical protein
MKRFRAIERIPNRPQIFCAQREDAASEGNTNRLDWLLYSSPLITDKMIFMTKKHSTGNGRMPVQNDAWRQFNITKEYAIVRHRAGNF